MNKRPHITEYPVAIAVVLAALYWILESYVDTLTGIGTFSSNFLPFTAHEIWQRLSVILILLAFGFYARSVISRLKGVRARLHLTQESLATLPHPIIWFDHLENIIFANAAALDLLGYTEFELLHMKFGDIAPEMAGPPGIKLWDNIKAGRSVSFRTIHKTKAGREFPVQVSASYCSDIGSEYVFAAVHNIEDVEKAQQHIASLARFVTENPGPLLRISYMGQVIFTNPAANPLLAYWNTEVGQDLPPDVFDKIRSAIEIEQTENIEFEAAGRIYSFLAWANPTQGYCNLYGRDVTEQRQFQQSLEFTTFSLENAAENVYWIDKDSHIVYANESACRKLGYSRDELLSMTIPDIDPIYDKERWPLFWKELLEKNILRFESVHKTKLGVEFPVEITTNYFEFKQKPYCFAFIQDITQRKQVQSQLLDRTHELAVLLHAAEKINMTLKTDVILRELIARALELTGAAAGTAGILKDDQLVFNNYSRNGKLVKIEQSFAPGKGATGRVIQTKKSYISNDAVNDPYVLPDLRRKFGFYDLINVPILGRSGDLLGDFELHDSPARRGFNEHDLELLEGLSDIASVALENAKLLEDRLAAETASAQANRSLAEKNQELESIIFVASHDLRSAIVNIQGFSRELSLSCQQLQTDFHNEVIPEECRHFLAQPVEHEIPEALNFILVSTSRIDTLISGLLRLSRITREPIDIKAVNVNELISEIYPNFEFQVRQADVKFVIEDVPPCLADREQLRQVFTQLIDNSLKFLDPEKPGLIKISGFTRDDTSVYCIEDNGIGIDPKFQFKIFEIFHRLYPETFAGEGLGLTIVRRIVERHNGRVWVESQPGRGSRFFFSLPVPPKS